MAKILITGFFRFPQTDATAVRTFGIGKALREAGHDVFFAGCEEHERPEDLGYDGRFVFQGFPYKSLGGFNSVDRTPWGRLRHFLRRGDQILEWLEKPDTPKFDLIIATIATYRFGLRMFRHCRASGTKLIVENGEWHVIGQFLGGVFSLPYWSFTRFFHRIIPKVGNVIVPTGYLQRHFKRKRCHVIRVPHLVDFDEPRYGVKSEDFPIGLGELRLVYAGYPKNKDLLLPAIEGAALAKKEGLSVRIDIYGVRREEYCRSGSHEDAVINELGDAIRFHGWIQQDSIPQVLSQHDASILIRPNLRYAHAGLATKLIESMAVGLPVFANNTGDTWEYLTPDSGIRVADDSPQAFLAAIKEWFGMSHERKVEMRRRARSRAEKCFNYKNYADELDDFVNACQ